MQKEIDTTVAVRRATWERPALSRIKTSEAEEDALFAPDGPLFS